MSGNSKQAFSTGLIAILGLALAMVLFYHFSDRFHRDPGELDLSQKTEAPKSEDAAFVGMYSPSDGPLQTDQGRISYFNVNHREEGGYLGSATVNEIGGSGVYYFKCMNVRIEQKSFFLECTNDSKGTISLDGSWSKDASGALSVAGKVLWVKDGTPLLEVQRQFDFRPAAD